MIWEIRRIRKKGVKMGTLISDKYAAWKQECEERFQKLKHNEEEVCNKVL